MQLRRPKATATTALGPEVTSGLGVSALGFLAARHLTYYRPEHYALVFYAGRPLTPEELKQRHVEIAAWVKLKPGVQATAEEIQGFCRSQIAHYKIPRYVLFVESFPMTVTGKAQKYLMRQHTIAQLGLQDAALTQTA